MSDNKPTRAYRRGLAAIVASVILLSAVNAWAGDIHKLRVDGLACPFCAYGIEKQLKNISGVKSVTVSVKTGTVTVTMNDGAKLTHSRANQAVKDAGFTLRSFR